MDGVQTQTGWMKGPAGFQDFEITMDRDVLVQQGQSLREVLLAGLIIPISRDGS